MDDQQHTPASTDGSHVGLNVRVLDAAMAHFTKVWGYRWPDVLDWEASYYDADGHEHVDRVRFTMSVDGPPHLELMEASTGIFAARERDIEMHHVARWVDDFAAAETALLEEGYVREAWSTDSEGRVRYAYFVSPSSDLRLELCDKRELENLRRWLAGGSY